MHKILYLLFFLGIFIVFNILSLGDYNVPFGVNVKEIDEQVTLIEKYNWRGNIINQHYVNEGSVEENLNELTYLQINESQFKKNFALVISLILFIFYFPFSRAISKKFNIKEDKSVLSPFWEKFFLILAIGIYMVVLINVFVQYPELMEETQELINELEPYIEKK